jgi:hypothetical protein
MTPAPSRSRSIGRTDTNVSQIYACFCFTPSSSCRIGRRMRDEGRERIANG